MTPAAKATVATAAVAAAIIGFVFLCAWVAGEFGPGGVLALMFAIVLVVVWKAFRYKFDE